jgi:ABC-type antimicrobial peptide transport system permease subunit
VRASLDARDDVESWTGLGFTSLQVDSTPVVALITMGEPSPVLTVVRGRLPTGDHEVALGSHTASAHHVGVGDAVRIEGDGVEARDAVVTAIVALPAVGPYQSDRAGPGEGVVVPAATFDDEVVAALVGFIAIDAASSTDGATLIDDLQDDTVRWSVEGDEAFSYAEPVRPAEIANAASMRAVPLVVGGLLATAAAMGFWLALMASVRARRRSLGVLRALGFTGGQLRTSVRAQALAVTAAALLVGVPLGIVVGRLAWRSFAARLGVVTDPSVPLVVIASVVAGWLLMALAAGAHPGRTAARVPSAEALRSE